MIINQSAGFTFIHIPKSGGTSVTQFLAPLNGPFDLELGGTPFGEAIQEAYNKRHRLRKHSTLTEARHAIDMVCAKQEVFVFAFVRNPYERLLSVFDFLRSWEDYDSVLLSTMKGFTDFAAFVKSGIFASQPGPDGMFRPQSEWLKLDGQIASHVRWFRIEEIGTALEAIYTELASRGADLGKLSERFPHANRSQSQRPARIKLDKELVKMIDDFYAEDFQVFDYHHGCGLEMSQP